MSFEISNTETGTKISFLGASFEFSQTDQADWEQTPFTLMKGAGETAVAAISQARSINSDPLLSDLGKAQRAAPFASDAVAVVAAAFGQIRNMEIQIDVHEQQLFKVPEIDPAASVTAIEDREIRDWWRSMSNEERSRTMGKVEGDGDHTRLLLAIIRAPAPLALLSRESEWANDAWKGNVRRKNPETFASIDAQREVIEKAKRGIAMLGNTVSRMAGISGPALMDTLLDSQREFVALGSEIFGISDVAFLQAKGKRQRGGK